ncbi:MAG: sigma-70 family RNA polymerase sigma factor [Syntrophobacteraceae bacterium]
MARDEDNNDIAEFLSGNRMAIDRLILRHQDRIFNLCYRLLGDLSDAEDCAQETFVKVFRSLKNFRLESSFSTWLFTIAVNTCRNKRSSSEFRFWKRVFRIDRQEDDEGNPKDYEIEDMTPSPLARMTEKEREVVVQSAIASLPHDHRTVIVLRHVEGLSYEEICKITGYNLGTVKSKLARARLQLQKKLQDA